MSFGDEFIAIWSKSDKDMPANFRQALIAKEEAQCLTRRKLLRSKNYGTILNEANGRISMKSINTENKRKPLKRKIMKMS